MIVKPFINNENIFYPNYRKWCNYKTCDLEYEESHKMNFMLRMALSIGYILLTIE
jgi:hypothetical protein